MDEDHAHATRSDEQQVAMWKERVRKAQEMVRPYLRPGQSLSEELIAERREEAKRE